MESNDGPLHCHGISKSGFTSTSIMRALCLQALPAGKPAEWREKEEVQDLYSVYAGRQQDAEKKGALQKILGISEAEAQSLEQLVSSGQFKLEQEVEEEAFF